MSKQQQSVDFHHWCFCVFDSFFGLCFFFHMVLRTQPNPFNLAERPLNQRRRKKKKNPRGAAAARWLDATAGADSTLRSISGRIHRVRTALLKDLFFFFDIFFFSSLIFRPLLPRLVSRRNGTERARFEWSYCFGRKKNQFNSIGQSSDRVRVTSKCLELVFWDLG